MQITDIGAKEIILGIVRDLSEANGVGWPKRDSTEEMRLCELIRGVGVNGVVSRAEFDALLLSDLTPPEHIAFARSVLLMLDVFVAE